MTDQATDIVMLVRHHEVEIPLVEGWGQHNSASGDNRRTIILKPKRHLDRVPICYPSVLDPINCSVNKLIGINQTLANDKGFGQVLSIPANGGCS